VRGARAGAQLGYIDVSERACKGFGASLPVSWDSQTETLGNREFNIFWRIT